MCERWRGPFRRLWRDIVLRWAAQRWRCLLRLSPCLWLRAQSLLRLPVRSG